jgi:hypothetical protein
MISMNTNDDLKAPMRYIYTKEVGEREKLTVDLTIASILSTHGVLLVSSKTIRTSHPTFLSILFNALTKFS